MARDTDKLRKRLQEHAKTLSEHGRSNSADKNDSDKDMYRRAADAIMVNKHKRQTRKVGSAEPEARRTTTPAMEQPGSYGKRDHDADLNRAATAIKANRDSRAARDPAKLADRYLEVTTGQTRPERNVGAAIRDRMTQVGADDDYLRAIDRITGDVGSRIRPQLDTAAAPSAAEPKERDRVKQAADTERIYEAMTKAVDSQAGLRATGIGRAEGATVTEADRTAAIERLEKRAADAKAAGQDPTPYLEAIARLESDEEFKYTQIYDESDPIVNKPDAEQQRWELGRQYMDAMANTDTQKDVRTHEHYMSTQGARWDKVAEELAADGWQYSAADWHERRRDLREDGVLGTMRDAVFGDELEQYWTYDEASTYYGLKDAGRDAEAREYKQYIDYLAGMRRREETDRLMEEIDYNPVLRTASAIFNAPMKIVNAVDIIGQNVVNSIGGTGIDALDYKPINYERTNYAGAVGNKNREIVTQQLASIGTLNDFVHDRFGWENDIPIIGNLDWGDIYGAGVDSATSIVNTVLFGGFGNKVPGIAMGVEKYSDEFVDAKDAGATDKQAGRYAAASAVAEGIGESFELGEIYRRLAKMDGSISFPKIIGMGVVQALEGGAQEGVTTVLEQVAGNIWLGENSSFEVSRRKYYDELIAQGYGPDEAEYMSRQMASKDAGDDFLASVLIGAISGGGGRTIVQGALQSRSKQSYADEAAGLAIRELGNEEELARIMSETSGTEVTTPKSATALGRQYRKYMLDASEQLARIRREEADQAVLDIYDEQKGIAAPKDSTGNAAMDTISKAIAKADAAKLKQVREALVKSFRGRPVSKTEADMLKADPAAMKAMQSWRDIKPDRTRSERAVLLQEQARYASRAPIANIRARQEFTAEVRRAIQERKNAASGTSDEMREKAEGIQHNMTTSNDGSTYVGGEKVAAVGEIKSVAAEGKYATVTVTMQDGSSRDVSINDVEYGDDANSEVLSYAAVMATPELANAFVSEAGTSGVALDQLANGMNHAYDMGLAGYRNFDTVRKSSLMAGLTDAQVRTAYNMGTAQRGNNIAAEQQKATARQQKYTGAGWKGGKVDLGGIDYASLDDGRKQQVQHLEVIAGLSGINIRLFESKANAEGKYASENGSYNKATNTIRIDINAGINKTTDSATEVAMLRTLSHEVTHAIQRNSPDQYNALRDAVLDVLAKQGEDIDELVAAKMSRDKSLKERDEAVDEVVADACEMMLRDTNVIEQLQQMHPEAAKTFGQKVLEILKRWRDAIAKVFGKEYSTEAKAIAKALTEDIDRIRALWEEGLKTTAEVSGQELAAREDGINNTEAFNDSYEAIQNQARPPYTDGTKACDEFVAGLNEEARATYDLLYNFYQASRLGKQNLSSKFMYYNEWNAKVAENRAWAERAQAMADTLPVDVRRKMNMNPDGTLNPSSLEVEFKMNRSMGQRIIDALGFEVVDTKYTIEGKTFTLSDGNATNAVGGEAYRRALCEEVRKAYRNGTLKQARIGTLSKDRWGSLGFLASNGKTGASGDFTTLCPQMFYNKGCYYCYRLAALKSGVNNKLVGANVWYGGEILRIKDSDITMLNENGGLRIQSFGDWMPQFSSQLADMLYDAELRGLQVKIITKEPSMIEYVARLREQGLGKNLYFNLSADYAIERAGKSEAEDYTTMNTSRPYMRDEQGDLWWKRAMTVQEANKYRKKYDWVNTRIVATTQTEFIRGLKDPTVDVVTGYHGNIREWERIDSETGDHVVNVEPLGDAGMPVFGYNAETNEWKLERDGKTKAQKALAKAIEAEGLQFEYYTKTCCIDGRCAKCKGKCGAMAKSFSIKNATNRDAESVAYWQREMEYDDNDTQFMELDDVQYSVREGAPPKTSAQAYKLFNVDENGLPHALFIDAANALELGTWYDADSPLIKDIEELEPNATYYVDRDGNAELKVFKNRAQSPSKSNLDEAAKNGGRYIYVGVYKDAKRKGQKSYANWGLNGSGQVNTFAMRPGWHMTNVPAARHIGAGRNGGEALYRRPNQRWFLVEYATDVDYNDEAAKNPTKDIATHLPTDGWYSFRTNTNAEAEQDWIISGALKIVRPVTEREAHRIAREAGVPEDLPYKDGIKAFTEEDTQFSARDQVDAENPDIRYQQRDPDQISVREILAGLAEVMVKADDKATTEAERKQLETIIEYRKQLLEYEDIVSPLDGLRKTVSDLKLKAAQRKSEAMSKYQTMSANANLTKMEIAMATKDDKTIAQLENLPKRNAYQEEVLKKAYARQKELMKKAGMSEEEYSLWRYERYVAGDDLSKQLNAYDYKKLQEARKRIDAISKEAAKKDLVLLQLESATPLRNLVKREQERIAKAAEKRIERYRQTQDARTMREQIKKKVTKLDETLRHSKDGDYIPDELRHAMLDMLTIIHDAAGDDAFMWDNEAEFNARKASEKKHSRRVDMLKLQYQAMREQSKKLQGDYDETIVGELTDLSEIFGNKRFGQLNRDELKKVRAVVDHFAFLANRGMERFRADRSETIGGFARRLEDYLGATKTKKKRTGVIGATVQEVGRLVDRYGKELMTPTTFSRVVGGPIQELMQDLLNAESDMGIALDAARERIKEIKRKHEYDKWDFKAHKEFVLGAGGRIWLNVEEAMMLYATYQREIRNKRQSARHLRDGGVVEMHEDKVLRRISDGASKPKKITEESMREIEKWLTPQQKAYADEMVELMSGELADRLNAASRKLSGFSKFGEEYYFPYVVSPLHIAKGSNEVEAVLLRNWGAAKSLKEQATKPLVLAEFTDAVANHIERGLEYAYIAVPQDNMQRVLNYENESGDSMRQMITDTLGENALRYIDTFSKDISGVSRVRNDAISSLSNRMISAFKRNAVVLKTSVWVQQYSAIYRAQSQVDMKYFYGKIHNPKTDWDELKKYSGTAVIKDIGRFDTGIGHNVADWLAGKESNTAQDWVIDRLGFMPEVMDKLGWIRIWNAVKREQAAKTGLDINSDKLKKMAGRRFDEVIRLTQVYDSVFAKNAFMRSDNPITKSFNNFMGEPTQHVNMWINAAMHLKDNPKLLLKTAVAMVISSIMKNLALAPVRAGLDDDEEKSYWEKVIYHFFAEMAGDANPLGYLPFVSSVYDNIAGWKSEKDEMEVITDGVKLIQKLFDSESGWQAQAIAGADLIGLVANIPVANLRKDLMGFYRQVFKDGDRPVRPGALKNAMYYGWAENSVVGTVLGIEDTRTFNVEQMYGAMLAGDAKAAEDYRNHILLYNDPSKSGEKGLHTTLRTRIKKGYLAGDMDDLQAQALLVDYGGMSDGDAYMLVESWEYESGGKDWKKTAKVIDAIDAGDADALEDAVAELVEYGGYDTPKEAAQTIASGITSTYKPAYIEASPDERRAMKTELLDAYETVYKTAGVEFDRSARSKQIDKWVED